MVRERNPVRKALVRERNPVRKALVREGKEEVPPARRRGCPARKRRGSARRLRTSSENVVWVCELGPVAQARTVRAAWSCVRTMDGLLELRDYTIAWIIHKIISYRAP